MFTFATKTTDKYKYIAIMKHSGILDAEDYSYINSLLKGIVSYIVNNGSWYQIYILPTKSKVDSIEENFVKTIDSDIFNTEEVSKAVMSWENDTPLKCVSMEREKIIEGLLAIIKNKEDIEKWMVKPNKAFGGKSPDQILHSGNSFRLWQAIYLLSSGQPS